MLRESRNAKPDHPLCHISDLTFSYAQVDEISGRVASALLGSGLRRGDKVAVQLPNLPQFLFTYFAILKAGLVMVPLNPLLKAPEVAYQLQDSESRMLITFEGFAAEAVAGARQAGDVPTYVVNLPGSDQRPEGTRHYDELYFADDTGEIEPVNADDTAVIIYTSGTTGKPKGAELTHFQLYMNCTVAGELFGFRDDDIGVAVLPMFHVFGLSSVLNVGVRFAGDAGAHPPVRARARCSTRSRGTGARSSPASRPCTTRCCKRTSPAGTCRRCGSGSPAARRSRARSSARSRRSSPAW